ncbi:MAG: hypothetical protein HQM04_04740 [Magnetococcales bacterium]|nr:hypothetical protein [Magnetococcales bacterium]MBF0114332.1 hypothetical protein [Magnetococcales bacterium]
MEEQRINFYQDSLRPQKPFLPFKQVVMVWLLLGLLLLLASHALREPLAQRRQTAQEAVQQRAVTESSSDAGELARCRTAWQKQEAQERGGGLQMSTLLEQMAAVHLPGIWLTQVQWQRGGTVAEERLEIAGVLTGAADWLAYQRQLLGQLPGYVVREASKEQTVADNKGKPFDPSNPVPFRLRIEAEQPLQGQR